MRRFLQRTASWACALLVLVAQCALGATTRIVPLVDRPGACSYCASVKAALEAARESVDLLLSDAELDGNPLLSWVVSVVERGVPVRAILDSSDWSLTITEKNRPTVDYLRERGVDARFDDPAVTTHAKLVVVDRRVVILGSTNWNRHAVSEQEQANVLVEDERIGGVFAEYFERLWNETLPEAGVVLDLEPLSAREPYLIPIPEVAGTTNYVRVLTQLLASAQRSVHVVMYRASHYPGYPGSLSNVILQGVIDAAGRGLDVRIVLDDCAFFPDSAEANLEAALFLHLHGVDVRLDDPSVTTHAKLVIVDEESVLVGSTNWNYYSLEKDNEVDLAFIGLRSVALPYERFFRLVWEDARRLSD
jgi:phosphatidylserine/phosphatidylglycerophosphate/cardiolipin synthase-like enzyme